MVNIMTKWIDNNGPMNEIVISSRLRLARNLSKYPFPMALNNDSADRLIQELRQQVYEKTDPIKSFHTFSETKDLSLLEKRMMLEKHLVSSDFIGRGIPRALILKNDETMSIMINEEDHIRIQCLLPGLQLDKGWELADEMDDYFDEMIDYAFDEQMGYLTSCTTNVGTGLRASVMMHLPALTMTGYIERIYQAASQMGLAVRGMFGEGSEALGDMYQISNQITLGRTEIEIINSLNEVATQIVERELATRKQLIQNSPYELEDTVHRAFGVLANARILSSKEALEKMSFVRMGIALKMIETVSLDEMNHLLLEIQPAFLQKYFNKELQPFERDVKRAEFIREKMVRTSNQK